MSKAAFVLAQALTLCGSLQATETEVIKEEVQQVGDLLTSTDFARDSRRRKCPERRHPVKKDKPKETERPIIKDKPIVKEHKEKPKVVVPVDPRIEHLYAFNVDLTSIDIPVGANVSVSDVPFNDGTGFPHNPLVIGKAILQLDDTDFIIREDGDYLVTFYGYNDGSDPDHLMTVGVGVQLFVNETATGPASIAADSDGLLSFSEIIRVTGTTATNFTVVEVRAVSTTTLFPTGGGTLNLVSSVPPGINATLEIVKLNP